MRTLDGDSRGDWDEEGWMRKDGDAGIYKLQFGVSR